MREIRDPDVLANIQVPDYMSMIDVIRRMNETSMQILVVIDSEKSVVGVITDGDVRRALINGLDFSARAREICNTSPKTVVGFQTEEALKLMEGFQIIRIPVIDNQNHLIGLYKYEQLFAHDHHLPSSVKVVIMAGGKGTRLRPITDIIPKPLIPVRGKPMIEMIMEAFSVQGLSKFILSVNYKKEFVKAYFKSRDEYVNSVVFIEEEDYLGTAGSLHLLSGLVDEAFFLTNCDILVRADYSKAFHYHKSEANDITVIGGLKRIPIPYGIVKMENGQFLGIEEKPELHYMVNTGVYIIEPGVVQKISRNEFLDMPNLIRRVMDSEGKVGIYPTHEDWVDIGSWAGLNEVPEI